MSDDFELDLPSRSTRRRRPYDVGPRVLRWLGALVAAVAATLALASALDDDDDDDGPDDDGLRSVVTTSRTVA